MSGGGIEVSRATLEQVQRQLEAGAADLEGTAGAAPGAVDAGVMSGVVNGILERSASCAAGLSEGLTASRASVARAGEDYRGTDEGVGERLAGPGVR